MLHPAVRKALLKGGWLCFRAWLWLIGERKNFVIRQGELYREGIEFEGEHRHTDGTVDKIESVEMNTW